MNTGLEYGTTCFALGVSDKPSNTGFPYYCQHDFFPILAALIFLVDKLPTFCCGYIGQVACKRSATINKSGLNMASGVMMFS